MTNDQAAPAAEVRLEGVQQQALEAVKEAIELGDHERAQCLAETYEALVRAGTMTHEAVGARVERELGKLAAAREPAPALDPCAEVARKTGVSVKCVARAAGALSHCMGIDVTEWGSALATLVAQCERGPVGIQSVLVFIPSLAPLWGGFHLGTGLRAVRELGAALQVTATGAPPLCNPSSPLTALLEELVEHHGRESVLDLVDQLSRCEQGNIAFLQADGAAARAFGALTRGPGPEQLRRLIEVGRLATPCAPRRAAAEPGPGLGETLRARGIDPRSIVDPTPGSPR